MCENINRICTVCGTDNEDDYAYCKSCGTPLPVSKKAFQQNAPYKPDFANITNAENHSTGETEISGNSSARYVPPINNNFNANEFNNTQYTQNAQNLNQNAYNQNYNQGMWQNPNDYNSQPANIEGISIGEVSQFVSSNQEYFIPKFLKNKSSASWNWPVFLFGALLGMPFIWFFYRKMYKIGSIILAITLALNICTAVGLNMMLSTVVEYFPMETLSVSENIIGYSNDISQSIPEIYYSGQNDGYAIIPSLTSDGIIALVAGFIIIAFCGLVQLAVILASSITANGMYRRFVIKKLAKIKSISPNPAPFELANAGGTSSMAGISIGIAMGIVYFAISLTPFFAFILALI